MGTEGERILSAMTVVGGKVVAETLNQPFGTHVPALSVD
jgi:hypothetical protein